MKIYPKINEYLEGIEKLEKYIKESKGLEIQYFHKNNEELVDFNISKPIIEILNKYPYIEEITVHPPLKAYEIENICIKDKNIFLNQIKEIKELSNKYNIKINIVEHTRVIFSNIKLTYINVLKEALEILKESNCKILVENMFLIEEQTNCTVLELASYLNNKNLMVCMDLCHLYCQSHIYKYEIKEFLKQYLDKDKCKNYVYQVHFSDTKDNDGYIKQKATHGLVHDSINKLFGDLDLLKEYNMNNCIYVTEVGEKDYINRPDQEKEILMIKEYLEK